MDKMEKYIVYVISGWILLINSFLVMFFTSYEGREGFVGAIILLTIGLAEFLGTTKERKR